jgi:hypothetical protein
MSDEKIIIFETNLSDGKMADSVMAFVYINTDKLKRLHQALALSRGDSLNRGLHARFKPTD